MTHAAPLRARPAVAELPTPDVRERLAGIDRVKALAILAVIATHAGPPWSVWAADWSTFDACARLTWNVFAVPGFLMTAGMLYRRHEPMPLRVLGQRLARVAVPLGVALAAFVALGVVPLTVETFGGGPYYFLPLLAECIVVAWVLSRFPDELAWAVVGVCAAFAVVYTLDPFWLGESMFQRQRNPLRDFSLGFFVIGWLGVPQQLATRNRRALLVGALACLALWMLVPHNGTLPRLGYSVLVVAWLLGAAWTFPGMRLLSEASLLVYLLQEPLLLSFHRLDAWAAPLRFAALMVVAVSLGLGAAVLARQVLGPARARFWLGA